MLTEQKTKKILEFLSQCQQKADPLLIEELTENVSKKFHPLVKHQIETGGKRIRPALTIACCHLLGGKTSDVLAPACGLEILHTYSLIIDDIIDNGLFRRNKPTVWAKYGKSIAQCIAIFYASSIFQTTQKSPKPLEVSGLFSKTLKTLIEGEILDILFEREGRREEPYIIEKRPKNISFKQYLEMITQKTGALLSACCELGGIIANANPKEMEALKEYGINLGIAFQMQDDILDMFGDEKSFGKKIGKDIEERKGGNLVLMMAFKKLSVKDKAKINSIMKQDKLIEADKKEIMGLIKKTNALIKSMETAKSYAEQAKKALKKLPQNHWNELLADLVDFVVERGK
ncbi:MAG: polyprenyl synthetase family protein [Candidatus Pacebacteria bacterium]|nr:polyprenyl synthetase family protein [Candidatus Paceibacterota bacterium]